MEYKELWEEILGTLAKSKEPQDILQVGVNILARYLEGTESSSVTLGLNGCVMEVSISDYEDHEIDKAEEEPETEPTVLH